MASDTTQEVTMIQCSWCGKGCTGMKGWKDEKRVWHPLCRKCVPNLIAIKGTDNKYRLMKVAPKQKVK